MAASVTYQDLIKTPYDESLFEFYGTTQLMRNSNGVETKVGTPAIYSFANISPDHKYLLMKRIEKPFSYLVTAGGFNSTMLITDLNGKEVKRLAKLPSSELAPSGYDNVLNARAVSTGCRIHRPPLVWIEPLDSGLIKKKVDFHDAAYTLAAPFTGTPAELTKTAMRMGGITDAGSGLFLVSEMSR
ncbi:MAG: hypothetical protein IPP31_10485 [Chitinophagaceae bacterium]|nr:hypothetical protein [Chitinophagaceae bacterium]